MQKFTSMWKDKRWLYGASFVLSIYMTYLFSRLWYLDVKGIVTIGAIFCAIFLSLTRVYVKKNNHYPFVHKKRKAIFFIGTFFISVFLLIIGRNFFVYDYGSTEIRIQSTNDKPIHYDVIDEIYINNLTYVRDGKKMNDAYRKQRNIKNDFITSSLRDGILTLKIKRCYSAKIRFHSKRDDLEIKDGKQTTVFSSNDVYHTYIIQSNHIKDSYWPFRTFASLIGLFYIVYLLLQFVWNPDNKKYRFLILAAISTMGIGLFYILDCSLLISPDSYSYIDFDFKSLLAFKPSGRTPLYPFIIHVIRYLFPFHFLEFTVLFQYGIWFISILYLYKIIVLLTKNEKLGAFFTILYAISPFAVIWNGSILTESFALSGTIFFIYFIIQYIRTDRVLYGNISILLSLALTFLRPTSIIYLVGLFLFIIMRLFFDKFKKSDIRCLITEIICLGFVVFYAICFHRVFGIYSISDAVVRQDLMVTMREAFYVNSDDKQFIQNINMAYENHPDQEWDAMKEVLGHYSLAETKKLTNDCRKKNFITYARYIIRLTKQHGEVKFTGYAFTNMHPKIAWLHNALSHSFIIMTFFHVYILVFVEMILMVIKWIKDKKIPWIYAGLFFFPLVIVVSSFVGTCGEFMRTACCCIPFAYLIFIMLMYDAFIKKDV